MREGTPRSLRTCLIGGAHGASTGIVRALHADGFAVLERAPTPNTVALAVSGEFDLVCWICEQADGATLAALSEIGDSGTPLVALLPEPTAMLISDALLAGADACLALNADPLVVRAQAGAILRRRDRDTSISARSPEHEILRVGAITVDTERCEVVRDGIPVPLTAQEFRVVAFMARNPGRVLPAHEILNAASDGYVYTAREAQDIFKATARRIRRKLEPAEAAPVHLVTVRGFGYRFEGGAREEVAATA